MQLFTTLKSEFPSTGWAMIQWTIKCKHTHSILTHVPSVVLEICYGDCWAGNCSKCISFSIHSATHTRIEFQNGAHLVICLQALCLSTCLSVYALLDDESAKNNTALRKQCVSDKKINFDLELHTYGKYWIKKLDIWLFKQMFTKCTKDKMFRSLRASKVYS